MLLDSLQQYLETVEAAVKKLKDVYVERYEEEILTARRANLRIRIRFASGHLLELNESIVEEKGALSHLGYRYHFQDGKNNLLFRYDNTPHFPRIATFPHHKHLPDRVVAVEQPSILEVIEEAKKYTQA